MKRIGKIPAVTLSLIVITCIVMVIMRLFLPLSNTAEQAIFMGAYYKPLVLAGEWWRMITVLLVHGSFMHLLCNCLSLLSLGTVLESMGGSLRFAVVFLMSVLGGSLFVFVADNTSVAVGMSAGIYGLFAWYLHLVYATKMYQNPMMMNSILRTVIINLLINFLPGVSWTAHLGGFLFGFVTSAILIPGFDETKRKHWLLAGVLFLGGMGYLSTTRYEMGNTPIYLGTDINLIETYQKMGLDQYGEQLARKLDDVYGTDVLETYIGSEYE